MSEAVCIWCKKRSSDIDREHIFPEAIGCPEHLTLPGTVVCRKCNNDLAHLDQIISDDFDFLTVMHGIKKKGGRHAEVASRGNVYARSTNKGPEIFFNLDPVAHTTPIGRKINPYRGRGRDIKPTITTNGAHATTEFSVSIGQNKKFTRGLYKIALNCIAYQFGTESASEPRYDWVRQYVKHGGQTRHVMLFGSQTSDFILSATPYTFEGVGASAMEIQIAFASFILDMTEDERLLPVLAGKARELYGEEGYSISPQ